MTDDALRPSTERNAEHASARMAPLARLPVFFALAGRRVVLAGGSEAASWKAELLSAAGAEVEIFATEPCEDLLALAADPPGGPVRLVARDWTAADLAGAALAIGAIEDDAEGERFAAAARAAGVPVNVVDKPAFCDFAFGAIVNRSPLVVGISTDGAAPVFGQAVRAKIEAVIPQGFKRWAEAARGWRPSVVRPLAQPSRPPPLLGALHRGRTGDAGSRAHPALRDGLLARAENERGEASRGSVTLVGAGPGDPELLTLKAVRVLQSADVVLYDDLVAPAVLDVARREARKMLVGKTGYKPSCKQDDINALMVSLAKQGKRVVRLKGGDPMVFGRAGEEISAARNAGIPVEVVPGISAAQGASSRLAVSLTHRDHARRLQFITAHARDGKLPVRPRLGRAGRSRRHHGRLHAPAHLGASWPERPWPPASIRRRPPSRCSPPRGRRSGRCRPPSARWRRRWSRRWRTGRAVPASSCSATPWARRRRSRPRSRTASRRPRGAETSSSIIVRVDANPAASTACVLSTIRTASGRLGLRCRVFAAAFRQRILMLEVASAGCPRSTQAAPLAYPIFSSSFS